MNIDDILDDPGEALDRIRNLNRILSERTQREIRHVAEIDQLRKACKSTIAWMDEHGYGGDLYRQLRDAIKGAE